VSHPWARKDNTTDVEARAAADVPAYANLTSWLATAASTPLAGAVRLSLGDSAAGATIDVAQGWDSIRAALAALPDIGGQVNVSKAGNMDQGFQITVGGPAGGCGCCACMLPAAARCL
jgi:hypothetical protein